MFKRGDIFKVSEYFRSTTLQHNGFVGRGELFSAESFLLGLERPHNDRNISRAHLVGFKKIIFPKIHPHSEFLYTILALELLDIKNVSRRLNVNT